MKILMIFTGGTIGSSIKDGYISTDASNVTRLLETVNDTGIEIELEYLNPYTILSETLNGTHIAMLARCIDENLDGYDGIIVCHGTDTLQYAAAAIAFAFADAKLPIVFVSSNYVLEDSRANGAANLKAAVEFITGRAHIPGLANRMRRCGVYVSYQNSGDETRLYNPINILPHQAYDDKLYVLDCAELIGNGDVKHIKSACLGLEEKSGILWIKAYPGMSYTTYISEKEEPVCILLDSYHSGTINTDDSSLHQLMKWAGEKGVMVYLIGLEQGVSYETTKAYGELGIKILPKMSPAAAYMWLWLWKGKVNGR